MLYSSLAAATTSVCTGIAVDLGATVLLPESDDDEAEGDDDGEGSAPPPPPPPPLNASIVPPSTSAAACIAAVGMLVDGAITTSVTTSRRAASPREATLYVGGVRQHAKVIYEYAAIPDSRKCDGSGGGSSSSGACTGAVRFTFTRGPESVRPGASVLFRHGRSTGIGRVTTLLN